MDQQQLDTNTIAKIIELLNKDTKGTTDINIYLVKIENDIRTLRERNEELYTTIKELQVKLLDPVSGVIVTVNKNSEWRLEYEEQYEELQSLLRWKGTIDKLMWIIIVALIGIGVKLIFLN